VSVIVLLGLFAAALRPKWVSGKRATSVASGKYQYTHERWERGQYIVENLAHCFMCHSQTDEHELPVAGRKGAGNPSLPGMPFTLPVPNITADPETGAGTWTDEQFVRALRDGIGHDGRVLFPVMPYMRFRNMPEEDLASVIVYIRSIPAVKHAVPKASIPEPFRAAIAKPAPPAGPFPNVDMSTAEKRGEYLVTIGNCSACHDSIYGDNFEPIPGMAFAGGVKLEGPWGYVASANLTPHPSGIPYYDETLFVQTIRSGRVKARALKPIMPWRYYAGLHESDLKDIFAYLRALPPVQHRVDNTEEPTYCKLCRARHGGGEWN
jgi:Cytochrome C oxidase, cbb3-type, subunit III